METIRLSPHDLQEAQASLAHGTVPVILSLSAFDVPNSLTVDAQPASIHVTFHYIDEEPAEPRVVDEWLTVEVGKHSGKVLGVVVRPDPQRPRDITVRIVDGVDAQVLRATRPNQRMNYELIKRVVRNKVEPLLAR